jgi:hypothetical protein
MTTKPKTRKAPAVTAIKPSHDVKVMVSRYKLMRTFATIPSNS